jgi:hypothetical protein
VNRSKKYFTCEFIDTEYVGTFAKRTDRAWRREDSANA